jgi:hypothetical protein
MAKCSKCGKVGGPGKMGKLPNGHRWFICATCVGNFVAGKQLDRDAKEAAERE